MPNDSHDLDPVKMQHMTLQTDQPITPVQLDYLFGSMLHMPQLLLDASRELTSDCFRMESEAHYATLWQAMSNLWTQYRAIRYEALVVECDRLFNSNAMVLDSMREDILAPTDDGLIYSMLRQPTDAFEEGYARDILRKFLHERIVVGPLRNVASQGFDGSYASNMTGILEKVMASSQRISALSANPVEQAMPDFDDTILEQENYIRTHVTFIDDRIGGERPGDANGILGGLGSGKSTLARQLAISAARRCYQDYQATGKLKVAFLVSYEEPMKKFQPAIWSCAAKIHRDRASRLRSFAELSTRGNLLDYERTWFKTPTPDSNGERERYQQASIWLNKCLVILDMSGSGKYPDAGTGGVDELAGAVEKNLGLCNAECGGIYIDYAGIMCKRYMYARGINMDHLRHYLNAVGDQVRRRLSEQYNTTSWIFHQLNGDANKRRSTTLQHHSDAADSRSFAENLANCGCLGTVDAQTNCLLLNWSKTRTSSRDDSPPVLQHHSMFSELIDVSKQYEANAATQRFLTFEESKGATVRGDTSQQPVRRMNMSPASVAGYDEGIGG